MLSFQLTRGWEVHSRLVHSFGPLLNSGMSGLVNVNIGTK